MKFYGFLIEDGELVNGGSYDYEFYDAEQFCMFNFGKDYTNEIWYPNIGINQGDLKQKIERSIGIKIENYTFIDEVLPGIEKAIFEDAEYWLSKQLKGGAVLSVDLAHDTNTNDSDAYGYSMLISTKKYLDNGFEKNIRPLKWG